MKKEDSQQGTNSESRDQQKNQTTRVSNIQQNDVHQAGLGRHRITDIEDLEGMRGRDNYAGSDNDDLSNEDLNASNDQ